MSGSICGWSTFIACNGRTGPFFAVAARLMRRVLVDGKSAGQTRGGALHRVTFDQNLAVASETPDDDRVGDALHALSGLRTKAQVVERDSSAAASRNGGSPEDFEETVMRDWKFAKNWLMREISRGSDGGQTGVRPVRPGSDRVERDSARACVRRWQRRGVTSASASRAHLIAPVFIACISGLSQLAST